MKKHLSSAFLLLLFTHLSVAQVTVKNLYVENLVNPIGLDDSQPRFSWQLESAKRNVKQSGYEIKVAENVTSLNNANAVIWSTGKVSSDSSVFIKYKGKNLESGKRYYWQVRVWDNSGKASAWSKPSYWQMGLLNSADWKAKWIVPGFKEDSIKRPSPLFRKQFANSKNLKSATAYITALGLYEAQINGQRVGDAYLTPGWTSYNNRLQYQTYDVTHLIKTGNNTIGATLGSGWYRGNLVWDNKRNFYGKDVALLFQLDLVYADGTKESIITDESWRSSVGSILFSEIYHGETIDARMEKEGWATAAYNDSNWFPVEVKDYSKNILVATYNEQIKKHETFKPLKVIKTPKGEWLMDFGQNLVGWVQIKITKANAGDSIILYHAEVLDKSGNFYTDNLRNAKQRNKYICKGKGEETFEPHFTFQGFRYIKIEGNIDLSSNSFTAVALYSDMQPTGSFTSSNPLINQLQKNIQWGQRGNFLDVPTDCPQRDERLGWTGDAQVFSRTASFNFNVHNFFTKWLKDVALDQRPNGAVPHVVPNVLGEGAAGSAGWADVATVIPWDMYLAYGDKKVLEDQYPSMKKWVDYMQENSKNYLWNTGFHFGDWLFYRPFDDNDGRSAITDKYLIAQSFYAHSTQLLINAARVLSKDEDVRKYSTLLNQIKEAFVKEYMTPNGRLVSSSQTAYVLALNFDMLPENLRKGAAEKLVQNIQSYDNHLTTGFLGTPYLCHVLTRFGYNEIAYSLLMQDSYPSWLYPVKMGATTIWERWDGIKPDGTFQTPGMNSYNHYAYGAIGDWLYRVVAGIDTDVNGPGYKDIIIKPRIGGGLTNVAASYQTNYGKVSSSWKIENNNLILNVDIPANTQASISIPSGSADAITESGKRLTSIKEFNISNEESGFITVKTGSGNYQFVVKR